MDSALSNTLKKSWKKAKENISVSGWAHRLIAGVFCVAVFTTLLSIYESKKSQSNIPLKWSSVSSDADFQRLSAEGQETVRNAYFNKIVAPAKPEGIDSAIFRNIFLQKSISQDVDNKYITPEYASRQFSDFGQMNNGQSKIDVRAEDQPYISRLESKLGAPIWLIWNNRLCFLSWLAFCILKPALRRQLLSKEDYERWQHEQARRKDLRQAKGRHDRKGLVWLVRGMVRCVVLPGVLLMLVMALSLLGGMLSGSPLYDPSSTFHLGIAFFITIALLGIALFLYQGMAQNGAQRQSEREKQAQQQEAQRQYDEQEEQRRRQEEAKRQSQHEQEAAEEARRQREHEEQTRREEAQREAKRQEEARRKRQQEQYDRHQSQQQSQQRHAGYMTRAEALDMLGLSKQFTQNEVKRAHKALVKKIHPDAGGSTYLMQLANRARDTLIDN